MPRPIERALLGLDGAYWPIRYQALVVEGCGRSEQAALESFADQFYAA